MYRVLVIHILRSLIRHRLLWVLLFVGIVITFLGILLGQLALEAWSKIIFDVGLFGIELLAVAVVLFWWSSYWSQLYHQGHQIYLWVANVRPMQLFFSLFIWFSLFLLGLYALWAILFFFIYRVQNLADFVGVWTVLLSLLFSWIKILVLLSLVLLFSVLVRPLLVYILGLLLYVLGHSTAYIYHVMMQADISSILQILYKILYYVLPHFHSLSYKDSYMSGLRTGELGLGVVIGQVLYIVIMLTIGGVVVMRYPKV
jgi:hypothetical protein